MSIPMFRPDGSPLQLPAPKQKSSPAPQKPSEETSDSAKDSSADVTATTSAAEAVLSTPERKEAAKDAVVETAPAKEEGAAQAQGADSSEPTKPADPEVMVVKAAAGEALTEATEAKAPAEAKAPCEGASSRTVYTLDFLKAFQKAVSHCT